MLAIMLLPPRGLQRTVFRELEYAAERGYFAPGEPLHGLAPYEVAEDMARYAPHFGGYSVEDLAPFVAHWLHITGRGNA